MFMKIVVRVGLGIVHICHAIKTKGVLSILPKIEFSQPFRFNMKTDVNSYHHDRLVGILVVMLIGTSDEWN